MSLFAAVTDVEISAFYLIGITFFRFGISIRYPVRECRNLMGNGDVDSRRMRLFDNEMQRQGLVLGAIAD